MERIAIVSTPRCGNMWLRRLLVAAYGLEERSAHTPWEVDWEALPVRCALQLHWRRTPEFVAQLERHGFRVVVLARHPFDVLLSILRFAPREPQTARWLDGEGGDERSILGATPASPEFLAYATSARARALLSVSVEWWEHADARVRYFELVADPVRRLGEIVDGLGVPPAVPVAQAVEAVRFADLEREARNGHFWLGVPGLWRIVLPDEVAGRIAAAQPAVAALGWQVEPVGLERDTARQRWVALAA